MNGLLLIDKPEGITSFRAVSHIKHAANEKRVGHTGTLDPMATGVLPIFLGRATALSGLLLDSGKSYTAKIKLGVTTDTDDITGAVIDEKPVNVTDSELCEVLKKFTGVIEQKPPMYSAIKKDGMRLYKLAREGKTAEIDTRKVEIYKTDILSYKNSDNIFEIAVDVSKGTYIRSLARDIGEALGCGATLYSLRRTFAGGFSVSDCTPIDKIDRDSITQYILNEETAVMHLKELNVTENQATRFCNGGQLSFDRLHIPLCELKDGTLFRVKSGNLFLGIGFADEKQNRIGIKCIINYPEGQER